MKKILFFGLFISLLIVPGNVSSIMAGPPPIPSPPSQEVLDHMRELGRENELKYGSGQGSVASPVPTPEPSLRPSPKPSPSASPLKSPAPSKAELEEETNDEDKSFIVSFFRKVSLWLQRIFTGKGNRIGKEELEPSPTPSLSPSPAAKANEKPEKTRTQAEEYYWKGFNIWVETKDYHKASEYYQKALEVDPDFAPALSSYGYLRGAFYGEYEKAEQYLKKAMQLDPNWAYAPYNLGLLYTLQGSEMKDEQLHKKGIEWIQSAVDQFPDHPDNEHFSNHLNAAKRYHQQTWGNE